MLIEIADGPHAGVRTDISATAPPEGLERNVPAAADAWLAAAIAPASLDREHYWYIAVYDADPAYAPPATGKGRILRRYRYRAVRTVARMSERGGQRPARALPAAVRTASTRRSGDATATLTLF